MILLVLIGLYEVRTKVIFPLYMDYGMINFGSGPCGSRAADTKQIVHQHVREGTPDRSQA